MMWIALFFLFIWRLAGGDSVSSASVEQCFNIAEARIDRQLNKNGFHRELTTQIHVQFRSFFTAAAVNCKIAVLETFPGGVYIDPDELRRIASSGNSTEGRGLLFRLLSPARVDVESFAADSRLAPRYKHQSQDIRLLLWPSFNHTDNTQKIMTLEMMVPVHARYHSAEYSSQHIVITIPPPRVLMVCENTAHEKCYRDTTSLPCGQWDSTLCDYQSVDTNGWAGVSVQVPVGDMHDVELVVVVTVLAVIAGCVVVMAAVFSDGERTKCCQSH